MEKTDNSSMYKENILELWKHPENFHELKNYSGKERGFNESCGDDITLYLKVKGKNIEDASFTGTGCALCMASSSVLTEKIKGMSFVNFKKLSSRDLLNLLEIEVHPARIKCILLPLETAQKIIDDDKKDKK